MKTAWPCIANPGVLFSTVHIRYSTLRLHWACVGSRAALYYSVVRTWVGLCKLTVSGGHITVLQCLHSWPSIPACVQPPPPPPGGGGGGGGGKEHHPPSPPSPPYVCVGRGGQGWRNQHRLCLHIMVIKLPGPLPLGTFPQGTLPRGTFPWATFPGALSPGAPSPGAEEIKEGGMYCVQYVLYRTVQ